MRLTSALHVRQWLAKLHPPLPQTPRESQQLLRILEGSFQKHLDEVHPSPAQRNSISASNGDIPLASIESSSSVTQHYFNNVLNNPLLIRPGERYHPRTTLTSGAVSAFVRALNNGSITIQLVRRCAQDYLNGIRAGEKVAGGDRLLDRLASWIYTAKPSVREDFLLDSTALNLSVQVAGIDQQEMVAWDWLKMLYERQFRHEATAQTASLSEPKYLSAEDALVSYIMQASIRRGELGDAAQQFVEACQYRSTSNRAAARVQDASKDLVYIPMEQCWKRLVAGVVHYRGKHGIPTELFDRAMQYGLSWPLSPTFNTPIASVYHPSSPSALALSQNLQSSELADAFLQAQNKMGKRFRRAMLAMLLDGAGVSLYEGQRQHARFLLDFARKNYSDFLPAIFTETTSLNTQIQDAKGELNTHYTNFSWT